MSLNPPTTRNSLVLGLVFSVEALLLLLKPCGSTRTAPGARHEADLEYHVENIDIPYKTLTKGVAMFKHKEDTLEPDDHALLNPLRWAEVVRLGQEGWELVSVQPLMRGVTEIGNQNAQGWAWGIALPVSYLLFFKRATS